MKKLLLAVLCILTLSTANAYADTPTFHVSKQTDVIALHRYIRNNYLDEVIVTADIKPDFNKYGYPLNSQNIVTCTEELDSLNTAYAYRLTFYEWQNPSKRIDQNKLRQVDARLKQWIKESKVMNIKNPKDRLMNWFVFVSTKIHYPTYTKNYDAEYMEVS